MDKSAGKKRTHLIDSEAFFIPVFTCKSLDETLRFYRSLGMDVTHEQTTPYVYGAVQWSGAPVSIHFHGDRKMKPERGSSCLILVDDVETPYHWFVKKLRQKYRGLPVKGLPRITRFRHGHTRFTLYDPDGNTLMFIAKNEPPYTYDSKMKDESRLMQALETAEFLRDTYHNDKAAAKKLDRAIKEYKPAAPVELARVLAARAELAVVLGEWETVDEIRSKLMQIDLTENEREQFSDELQAADELEKLVNP